MQRRALLWLCWVLPWPLAAAPAARVMIVGTKIAPPFVMRDPGGAWTGLSIDLWRDVAAQLGLRYEFREVETPEALVDGVARGRFAAALAAVSVTPDREQQVDFSQPYFDSGLSIAVPRSLESGWRATLGTFFSWGFVRLVSVLAVVLLGAAVGVWLFERRANPEQFGGSAATGLGAAFWWSAVTMTTVGYGDKAPRSPGGRLVAIVWMFTSVCLISGFTATIAASLTQHRLDTEIRGPADLRRRGVSVVRGSAAEDYLHRRNIRTVAVDDIDAALAAVEGGTAAACVYDTPLLKYALQNRPDLVLLPATFEPANYAIVLPQHSPLREAIDVALLQEVQGDAWRARVERYFGPD
ncbi:MAG TPA: transporter substrate-binding domain-containing protein [Opitutaceae bacterium]|nr:transporter substrate-binding domain-containing protein [Opitutaceae bacterium]